MIKIRELTKEEEIINAILHGIGMGLAIAALVVLVVFANIYGDVWHIVSFSVYGSTLVILYLASTLYHSFPQGKTKNILKIIDHSCVFLLIAGTYTPLTLIVLRRLSANSPLRFDNILNLNNYSQCKLIWPDIAA